MFKKIEVKVQEKISKRQKISPENKILKKNQMANVDL